MRGQRVTISENAVRMVSDGRLAGSAMTMIQTFRNLILLGGDDPDIRRVFEITSTAPAEILGLTDSGMIEKGRRADLVVLDSDYNLLYTLVNGEIAYEAPSVKRKTEPLMVRVTEKDVTPKPVKNGTVIGIRISDSSLWCGYVTDNEKVHITSKGDPSNPCHKQGFTGREAILDSSAEAVVAAWQDTRKKGLKACALGIATSGLVEGTKAVMAMNLPAWKDFDIAREITKRCCLKNASFPEKISVCVENSANAMAIAISQTTDLKGAIGLSEGDNFIYVKLGWGLGTGVVINGRPINCIEDIAPDYYHHLREAIHNVHMGLPTFLHQTVLINRLIARGELALMRTCDDEYPEMHLEALVSRRGMIHYAREEEKRAGKIFFRKKRINNLVERLKRDPYRYEDTTFELDIAVEDVTAALDGSKEEAKHAAAVFERMGLALGSGIFSLTKTLDAPIRHVVILPQIGGIFHQALDIIKGGIMTSLTRGIRDETGWKVTFIEPDDELFVRAGASLWCV